MEGLNCVVFLPVCVQFWAQVETEFIEWVFGSERVKCEIFRFWTGRSSGVAVGRRETFRQSEFRFVQAVAQDAPERSSSFGFPWGWDGGVTIWCRLAAGCERQFCFTQ